MNLNWAQILRAYNFGLLFSPASQEFLRILRKSGFRISLPFVHIPVQIILVHIFSIYFFKTNFNFKFLSTHGLAKWSVSFSFPHQHVSCHPHFLLLDLNALSNI